MHSLNILRHLRPGPEQHNHAPILEGGRPVRPMLTAASEQQPDVEPVSSACRLGFWTASTATAPLR